MLIDKLHEKLTNNLNLVFPFTIGFLTPDESMTIYNQPGSHVLNQDFAGNIEKTLTFSVQVRTQNGQAAESALIRVSNYIDSINNPKTLVELSENDYVLMSLQQSSLPYLADQDVTGLSTYIQDFEAIVQTNNKVR